MIINKCERGDLNSRCLSDEYQYPTVDMYGNTRTGLSNRLFILDKQTRS